MKCTSFSPKLKPLESSADPGLCWGECTVKPNFASSYPTYQAPKAPTPSQTSAPFPRFTLHPPAPVLLPCTFAPASKKPLASPSFFHTFLPFTLPSPPFFFFFFCRLCLPFFSCGLWNHPGGPSRGRASWNYTPLNSTQPKFA